jgi:hypothetical protein
VSCDSSVGIVARLRAGRPALHFQQGQGSFFSSPSRPIQWLPGALSPEVKGPGREADNLSPSNAEVKNTWSCAFTPSYVFMAWYLVTQRANFIFYSYFIYSE